MFQMYFGNIEAIRHTRAKEHPLRNYYLCADDRWIMMTLPSDKQEKQWPILCQLLGHPELEHDPRFDTAQKRFSQPEHLVKDLDQIFATKPRDEWLKILVEQNLFCCPINKVSELASDPQVMQNDYIVDLEHPVLGKVKVPGYPGQFSNSEAGTKFAAPELGEHTEEVLTKIGEYSAKEIKWFRRAAVI